MTGLEENLQASSVTLTYNCSHLGCLAAAVSSALMAVIGHNVALATDTHLVIVDNNSFPGLTRWAGEGPVCSQGTD